MCGTTPDRMECFNHWGCSQQAACSDGKTVRRISGPWAPGHLDAMRAPIPIESALNNQSTLPKARLKQVFRARSNGEPAHYP